YDFHDQRTPLLVTLPAPASQPWRKGRHDLRCDPPDGGRRGRPGGDRQRGLRGTGSVLALGRPQAVAQRRAKALRAARRRRRAALPRMARDRPGAETAAASEAADGNREGAAEAGRRGETREA